MRLHNLVLLASLFGAGLAHSTQAAPAPLADCLPVAKLAALEGVVSIKPHNKVLKTTPGALPQTLCAGDEVHTFAGRALIDEGRYSVALDQFSLAVFSGVGRAALNKGQSLFEVRKGRAVAGVEIKTRLSVIGVKGTRFLVSDQNDSVDVVLDQGVVEITSTQGPIELYRETSTNQPALETFDQYVKQHTEGIAGEQARFDRYKTQVHREFVAYVENLTLAAGKSLATQGHIAVERRISSNEAQAIEALIQWRDKNAPACFTY